MSFDSSHFISICDLSCCLSLQDVNSQFIAWLNWTCRSFVMTWHYMTCDVSLVNCHPSFVWEVISSLCRVVTYLKKALRQVCGMKQIIWPRNLQPVTLFAWWHGMPPVQPFYAMTCLDTTCRKTLHSMTENFTMQAHHAKQCSKQQIIKSNNASFNNYCLVKCIIWLGDNAMCLYC